MRCPYCSGMDDRVVDSRLVRNGRVIRRRRQCEGCAKRYTTYETIDENQPVIVKKDGRREEYSKDKLSGGILRACQKRPVPMSEINDFVETLEARLFEGSRPEVSSDELGESVMDFLKQVDPIAYIRFASVYRSFADLSEFVDEIQELIARSQNEA